jgi:Spy/CpxP family protein refolding chaperone
MLKNVPFRRRAAAIALGFAAVAAAGAYAYSADAADAPQAQPGMAMHHNFEEMRMHRISEELALTPQQQALAKTAMEKMRPSHEEMEAMRKRHEAQLVALMDPNFDPRKAAAEEDAEHAAMEAHKKDARGAWFALWDTFNPDQRVKARLMLLKMAEREHGHFGERGDMHGPDGMHGGPDGMHGGPDGMHGAPDGMPPPAKG